MTEPEYREIEAFVDDALQVFYDNRVLLSSAERLICEGLTAARMELHALRIEQESESLA